MRTGIVAVLCVSLLPFATMGCHRKPRKGARAPHAAPTTTTNQSAVVVGVAPSNTTPPAASSTPPPVAGPPPEMSESERKATARAAFQEGVKLQESGSCPDALPKFEVAQKFYPAPTHLLHLAQCQAATGKLVEASETYETLVRTPMTKDTPDAFKQSVNDAKKELAAIRPRVPTLRVGVTPAPSSLSSLVVKLNGAPFPSELLGIARPVNPGHYKVTVYAAGYKEATSEIDVGESAPKTLDLKLSK